MRNTTSAIGRARAYQHGLVDHLARIPRLDDLQLHPVLLLEAGQQRLGQIERAVADHAQRCGRLEKNRRAERCAAKKSRKQKPPLHANRLVKNAHKKR